MEKRWCVYYGLGVGYIEKITEHEKDLYTLYIRYSEGQLYELQLWDSRYVDRFDTWQEALKEFEKYGYKFRGYNSSEDYVKDNFPTLHLA